jgi:uncharacterized repeat protein (TIGR03803 family)
MRPVFVYNRGFGTTHAEVGAYLLWLWALPDPITEVVLRHHELPADLEGISSPTMAVHVADALINGSLAADTIACLTATGLGDRLANWHAMVTHGDGIFYGTTFGGGTSGEGTAFSLVP